MARDSEGNIVTIHQRQPNEDLQHGPASLEEALELFGPVMKSRQVPLKARSHFVRWGKRFSEFRIGSLRRASRTCRSIDVAAGIRELKASGKWRDWPVRASAVRYRRDE